MFPFNGSPPSTTHKFNVGDAVVEFSSFYGTRRGIVTFVDPYDLSLKYKIECPDRSIFWSSDDQLQLDVPASAPQAQSSLFDPYIDKLPEASAPLRSYVPAGCQHTRVKYVSLYGVAEQVCTKCGDSIKIKD